MKLRLISKKWTSVLYHYNLVFEEETHEIFEDYYYGLNAREPIIELAADRIKGPECIFKPFLVGETQISLPECIQFILEKFSNDQKEELLQNIYITV